MREMTSSRAGAKWAAARTTISPAWLALPATVPPPAVAVGGKGQVWGPVMPPPSSSSCHELPFSCWLDGEGAVIGAADGILFVKVSFSILRPANVIHALVVPIPVPPGGGM